MKVPRSFVIASIVCAAPFALAVRDDLQRKDRVALDDDALEDLLDYQPSGHTDDDDGGGLEDGHGDDETRAMTPDDLDQIMGAEPATMGPLLAGLALGADSENFQSEEVRERIEAYIAHHDISVNFDFDFVSLNAITVRVSGDEGRLRAAAIAAWGTPRLLGEDELVWLGTGNQRAVYTAMSDGFELRFERYATVDDIIAPKDKAKLGVEPFPLLGSTRAKLEQAMGEKLQESSYDDELSWAMPGIGNGSGATMVKVLFDPDAGSKIIGLTVESSTSDTEAVQAALVAKWGKPKLEDNVLTWNKNGATISVELYDRGFVLDERRR
jgi:hypothetical protein